MTFGTSKNYLGIIGLLVMITALACEEKQDAVQADPPISKAAIITSGNGVNEQVAYTDPIDKSIAPIANFDWKYDLASTDHSCNMPASLVEISALGFIDDETMIAVNDEKADLFFLDRNSCKVSDQVDFGKKGDYEGVEYVDGIVYVLKANGNVYPYDIQSKSALETIKSALKTVNDVEGLGYDPDSHMLVMACKGSSDLIDYSKKKTRKAFYGLDLEKKTLIEDPLWIIEDSQLFDFYEYYQKDDNQSQKSIKKALSRLKSFSPSGIAKHPIDNSFYILSSVGKLLVVCTGHGVIQHIEFLDESMFIQPEGIAFTSDGSMFISNEGKSFIGKIQGFDYKE
ncbi:MAG: hypothetical protein ACI9FN_002820 [Saprospiraceae bacterium]|jgi:uncharacterized protein YjiK